MHTPPPTSIRAYPYSSQRSVTPPVTSPLIAVGIPDLEFIPVEEVARRLGGICPRTVRRLSDKGELCQAVKVGGRSMYPKQEVIDFMHRKMCERRS